MRFKLTSIALAAAGILGANTAVLTADSHTTPDQRTPSGAQTALRVGGGARALLWFDFVRPSAGVKLERTLLKLFVNRIETAGTVSVAMVAGRWAKF